MGKKAVRRGLQDYVVGEAYGKTKGIGRKQKERIKKSAKGEREAT